VIDGPTVHVYSKVETQWLAVHVIVFQVGTEVHRTLALAIGCVAAAKVPRHLTTGARSREGTVISMNFSQNTQIAGQSILNVSWKI
jgi:hypothetical protein